MNKLDLGKFLKTAQQALNKHSPEILTGIGIAGMIGTTVMAVKATPKAVKLIEKHKKEERTDEITPIDAVKVTWKCYVPAAVTGVASVGCLIKAVSINTRRNAALVTAYNLSKNALEEYQAKVVENIGEKKEKLIHDQIAQEKLDKDPVSKHEVIITEKGNTLCYDAVFGRYFRSDMDTIVRAMNEINRKITAGDMYASLNEFYSELGLKSIDIGYSLGWNIDDRGLEVLFSSSLAEDGTPCLVIAYSIAPKYNYNYFFS